MSYLISRQKAYEVLTEYYHHNTKVQHDALREALDRVPSAEPERKWIPVTERLPEERKNVLVTTIDGDIKVSYRSDVTYWWNIGRGGVVAWMPLPEPYRGD